MGLRRIRHRRFRAAAGVESRFRGARTAAASNRARIRSGDVQGARGRRLRPGRHCSQSQPGRRIPYSLVGILQYIAPTLQLLVGVALLGEPFTGTQAVGFGCIWVALAIYAFDGWRRARRRPLQAAAEHCDSAVPPCDGAAAPKGP
jgi:hypothetical protein